MHCKLIEYSAAGTYEPQLIYYWLVFLRENKSVYLPDLNIRLQETVSDGAVWTSQAESL